MLGLFSAGLVAPKAEDGRAKNAHKIANATEQRMPSKNRLKDVEDGLLETWICDFNTSSSKRTTLCDNVSLLAKREPRDSERPHPQK